jgi:hypothetical protein
MMIILGVVLKSSTFFFWKVCAQWITGVAELIPIKQLIDRGYPDYSYPYNMKLLLLNMLVARSNLKKQCRIIFSFFLNSNERG